MGLRDLFWNHHRQITSVFDTLRPLRNQEEDKETIKGNVRHFSHFHPKIYSGRPTLSSAHFRRGAAAEALFQPPPSPDRSRGRLCGRLSCTSSCRFFPLPCAAPRPNLFTFRLHLDDNFAGERCDIRGGIGGDPGCERALRITRLRPRK